METKLQQLERLNLAVKDANEKVQDARVDPDTTLAGMDALKEAQKKAIQMFMSRVHFHLRNFCNLHTSVRGHFNPKYHGVSMVSFKRTKKALRCEVWADWADCGKNFWVIMLPFEYLEMEAEDFASYRREKNSEKEFFRLAKEIRESEALIENNTDRMRQLADQYGFKAPTIL